MDLLFQNKNEYYNLLVWLVLHMLLFQGLGQI